MAANQLEIIKTNVLTKDLLQKLAVNNNFKMDLGREMGFAFQIFQANEYLQKATPESIIKAVTNVVLTGLTLNPVLQQACLVPRNKKGIVECCLEPMYQGLITIMCDNGQAVDVYAHVVYAKDRLEIGLGTEKKLEHVPYYYFGVSEKDRGNEIGAYAVAVLPNGSKKFEFVPIERINQIMQTSESYKSEKEGKVKSSIWTGPHRAEMLRKTAIKALFKYMPKSNYSERVAKTIEIDNDAHGFAKLEAPEKTLIGSGDKPAMVIDQANNKKADAVLKSADKAAAKATENKPLEVTGKTEAPANKFGIVYGTIQQIVDQLKEQDLYARVEAKIEFTPFESMDEFLASADEAKLNEILNSL